MNARIDACHREDPAFLDNVLASYRFQVRGPQRTLGRVERHIYGRDGRLLALAVRNGRVRRREVQVPLDQIEWVFPRAETLVLADDGA